MYLSIGGIFSALFLQYKVIPTLAKMLKREQVLAEFKMPKQ